MLRPLLCLTLFGALQAPVQDPTDEAPSSPLARVAVIGASASHGYMIALETDGVPLDLAQALDLMIVGEHEPPFLAASSFLFEAPARHGEAFVSAAQARRPTLVVAVDFLFWFVYSWRQGEARMALLEQGLDLLERFDCPLLIAEVPDMSAAAGLMLPESVLPPEKERLAANERILAWAAERERVSLVPLGDFLERLRTDEELTLREQTVAQGEGTELLQWDQLHPTLEGLAWLALLCADQAERVLEEVDAEDLDFDVARLALALRERASERKQRGLGSGER